MPRRSLFGCILLLSLHIVCGKYNRTNDLYDFYASNPQGVQVFSLLNAIMSPLLPPSSLHVIYVGDCADFVDEAMEFWSMTVISYRCLTNDEDIDTCRYSLHADDRDLDFVRDVRRSTLFFIHCLSVTFEQASCVDAITSRSEVFNVSPSPNTPESSAIHIILIPVFCGCHDVIHLGNVAMLQLQNELQRSIFGVFPVLVFAFNCEIPSSVSLLSSRIDSQLRKNYPVLVQNDDAASWTMLFGHFGWAVKDFDVLESKLPAGSGHTENCREQGIQRHPNVLATVFDAQTLRFFSAFSPFPPSLSLTPPNGSVIYCDVPFSLQFSWLHHSVLQPLASSHRFNAGILEFRSLYLTTEATFRLQLSQEVTAGMLRCSDILPHAPLLVPLEGHFESFSTVDDADGGDYQLFYTLATPCSLPNAQIPDQYRAALFDAAIFTWDESNDSSQPPELHVSASSLHLSHRTLTRFRPFFGSAKLAYPANRVSERLISCPVD